MDKPAENHDYGNIPIISKVENPDIFLQEKKDFYKAKVSGSNKNRHSLVWFLVFALIFSLMALGAYTLAEIQKNSKILADLEKKQSQQVAGVSEEKATKIAPVSGYGFSIVAKNQAPESFKLSRETIESAIFKGRQSFLTKFVTEQLRDGKKLASGISVEVIQYDNQMNQDDFNQLVLKTIGENYQVQNDKIDIPRGHSLDKIVNPSFPDQEIYTSVTTDNYYLIKVYKELSNYSEFSKENDFTNGVLDALYLN